MNTLKCLVITICVVSTYASRENSEYQSYSQSTPAPAVSTHRPRYVMKDAILYLTPSQIKALEATQGLNKVIPMGNTHNNEDLQKAQYSEEELSNLDQVIQKQLVRQNLYQIQVEKQTTKISAPIVESNTVKPIEYSQANEEQSAQPVPQIISQQIPLPQIPQQSSYKYFVPSPSAQPAAAIPESYSYIKLFTGKDVHEIPGIQLFHPLPDHSLSEQLTQQNVEIQEDPLYRKKYKLVPVTLVAEKPKSEEQQWHEFSQQNVQISQNQELVQQYANEDKKQSSESFTIPKYLSVLKYAPQFEQHKLASEYQQVLLQIEKENAIAKAEAIRKSPPVVVAQEVTIKKRRPAQTVKHVSIPAQYRFFNADAKHVEIKTSEPLPLQIPKPVGLEIEKRSELLHKRNVLVDKPYFVPRRVPVQHKKQVPAGIHKSENLLSYAFKINHVWRKH